MVFSRAVTAHQRGDDQDPDQLRREQERYGPPENELPFPVAVQALLVRTDDVAVALSGVEVSSCGLSFVLSVRRRAADGDDPGVGLAEAVLGGRGGAGMLVGAEFADGRRTSTREREPDAAPDQPCLTGRGGGASDTAADQTYWLSPLPPPGELLVVVAAPALGIDEARVALDVAALLAAAGQVVELWPWSPPQEEGARVDDSPELPEGSWFAG